MSQSKTKIFHAIGADGYQMCHPNASDDWLVVRDLMVGKAVLHHWKPIPVHLVDFDEGDRLRRSDAPWFGGNALVLKERAVDAMQELLVEQGELLPLDCGDARLWIYHPTVLLDALDEQQSAPLRFDDGRIFSVRRPVLRRERLLDVPAFNLSCMPEGCIYFRSRFVDAWRKAGLTGLEFTMVWSG